MNYHFENLVLLVGTNPLPNYVVANYFLQTNPSLKKVYLLYSEKKDIQQGTFEYAENLKNLLIERHKDKKIEFHYVPLSNVGSAVEIENDIKKEIILLYNSSYHLNYTGGTKAMGIHAYRTLEERCNKVGCDCSFSYLDARSFRLIDDKKGCISPDLRTEVKISLNELIRLHGLIRVNEDSEFHFSEALKKFEKLIEENGLGEFYMSYKRASFLNAKGELIKKKKEITDNLRNMKAEEPLLSIVLSLPEDYRIFEPNGHFTEPQNNKALEKAIEFLDGGWLERYVYEIIKGEFKDCEVNLNWEIRKPSWPADRKFEIDLSIIKGYHLVGTSCTTAQETGICKSKGFEILHRVRQMGGEEARAVLITRLPKDKKDSLNEELKIDTGGAENILILGEEDLKRDRLISEIRAFIK